MKETDKNNIPRPEYPRPQFIRENNWINLNGEWDFAFDDTNIGMKEKWYKNDSFTKFNMKILVPFCFQSKLSGIEDTSFHDVIWYRREFEIPQEFRDKKAILHFGAVDYRCRVYVNGDHIDSHEGGYIGFSLDITDYVEKKNVLVVRVEDPSQDLEIPRGKQYWQKNIERIFYPRVSGIWQTVWLEFISSEYYIKNIKFIPDIDKSELIVDFNIHGTVFSNIVLLVEILFKEQEIVKEEISLDFLGHFEQKITPQLSGRLLPKTADRFKFKLKIPENMLYLWDVDNPNLYDLHLSISNKITGKIFDTVQSYFGMRKISISDLKSEYNKQILLNNIPIYQKLLLVQGYWPEGLYTAPSEEDIIKDLQYIKEFGFNGLRTHQKVFDPLFLSWCDKIGIFVWGEIGNSFIFTVDSQMRLLNEFYTEIERDYNHPSIITWVPINESWGVQGTIRDSKRASYTLSLYYLIKSIDPTRLVVDDDGWWHTETDICSRHFYSDIKLLPKLFEDEIRSHRRALPKVYLKPFKYKEEPIIYSEIGGFGYLVEEKVGNKWGYGELLKNSEDLYNNILNLLKEFDKRKGWIQGFCYTELYDQFQEVNGLLTINRKPKFPPATLKKQLDKMFY
ncbi:MAG: glycoside hydrolase family 2 protein [Candidatus Thorarchaeota archaeon]